MNAAHYAVWGRTFLVLVLTLAAFAATPVSRVGATEPGPFERAGPDDGGVPQSESGTPGLEEDERSPGDGRSGGEEATPRAGEPQDDDGPAGCIFDNRPLELLV